ncbi:hypothetical protein PACTADRAFT_59921 [Pachysolen tannophilus NRRL Y-2460]|uniref:SnoaL-like domain-containing protein n=1 Tax=Pachysolen tannophilus NRRL Y-2460 TaxID=669874 RepID=A0A1E4TQK3_PACTA|nr:hypothetical protein PACTADRAFT_59921 [Pachysolen tannophilus NRRL Y-2460]
MVYNITEKETQPSVWSHINGPESEVLDRIRVSELCKGWPVYRDASEWNNFRDLFVDEGGYIFTTWSGGVTVDEFIEVSKKGRARGDFIMHREIGTLVDLNPKNGRAVGKMKATITQRFNIDGIPVDIECDTRFIFFVRKVSEGPNGPVWKVQYYKVFYEKDKVVPVDGHTVPIFDPRVLELFPEGYRYLGAAQSTLGHKVLRDLPTMNNEGFYNMYKAIPAWLEGNPVSKLLNIPESAHTSY